MALGDILHNLEDTLLGTDHPQPPETVDPQADPAYDQEQGIKGSSQDPYGDPADQQPRS